jgi:hypothetical protein
MKTNKLRIFAVLAFGGLIALAPVVRADDTPASPPPGAGSGTNSGANRGANMDKLYAIIKPTDQQKEQLKPIFKDRADQMKALRQDTSLSQEDKSAKRKEIMDATNAKVKGVLNADQYAQYLTYMKEQGGRRRGVQAPQN